MIVLRFNGTPVCSPCRAGVAAILSVLKTYFPTVSFLLAVPEQPIESLVNSLLPARPGFRNPKGFMWGRQSLFNRD